jgi:hypothetical protein
MRSITLYILFSFLCLCVKAQDKSYSLTGREMELATYVPTAKAVKGMQYELSANAHSYYFDRAKKEIIIILKKDKEIKIGSVADLLVFDMDKNVVKWSISTNSFHTFVTARYIITSENGNTHCYDRNNGKQVWKKTDANVKYVDEQKGILLTDYIRALDINSGKIVWQKYMPVKYNWEDAKEVNDSAVIVAAGGLYYINLYSGKGWNTNSITSKDEFQIPSTMGVIPEKASSITVPRLENRSNVWKGTTSGIVMEDNTVYIATNKKLFSFDIGTGGMNWETGLGTDMPGISTLYVTGDKLVLVNEGKITNASGVSKRYGNTYMSFFNKQSGAKAKTVPLPLEGAVSSIYMSNDILAIVFDGGMYQYDIANDKPLGTTKFEAGEESTLPPTISSGISHYYDGENIIYNNGEVMMRTPKSNKGFLNNNKLYIVDTRTVSVIPVETPAK